MAEQVAAWNKQYSLLYDSYKKTTSEWLSRWLHGTNNTVCYMTLIKKQPLNG